MELALLSLQGELLPVQETYNEATVNLGCNTISLKHTKQEKKRDSSIRADKKICRKQLSWRTIHLYGRLTYKKYHSNLMGEALLFKYVILDQLGVTILKKQIYLYL